MSQYKAKCVTNAFRVRSVEDLRDALETEGFTVVTDPSALKVSLDGVLLDVVDEATHEVKLYAGGEFGLWPELYDPEANEQTGGLHGVVEAVSSALADDSVAVFTEIGSEKWDLFGAAVAVSASGETVQVSLGDVTDLAVATFKGATVKS